MHLSILVALLGRVLGEDLAGQIQDGKRARNANSCTSSQDGEVPPRDQTQPAESTSNLQQCADVLEVGSSLDVRNGKVGGRDEREHHDQSEEGGDKEGVDAESCDEEDERNENHGDVVESL